MALSMWWNEYLGFAIAETPEDAWAVMKEETGTSPTDYDPAMEWEPRTTPLQMIEDETTMTGPRKTPEEWVELRGRCFIPMYEG